MIHESRPWSGHGSTNPLLYKTELCTSFQISGYCPYGTRCKFAHGTSELRPVPPNYSSSTGGARPRSALYKTELCKSFSKNGHCSYHDRCQYAHGEQELRSVIRHPKYRTQLCRSFKMTGACRYGARCRFLHNHEDVAQIQRGPWGSDPTPVSFFSSSAPPVPESILDTKIDDSYGAIGESVVGGGEAKVGTLREQRHEHAVLEFLGIASSKQKQQQEQKEVCNFSFGVANQYSTSQRTWADLANPAKNEPPPMPSQKSTQKPTQKPMQEPMQEPMQDPSQEPTQKQTQEPTQKPGMNNDATFSGLFGARWGTF